MLNRALRTYDGWLARPLWQRLFAYGVGTACLVAASPLGAIILASMATGIAELPNIGGSMLRGWEQVRRRYPRPAARIAANFRRTREGLDLVASCTILGVIALALFTGSGALVAAAWPSLLLYRGLTSAPRRHRRHQQAALARAAVAASRDQKSVAAPDQHSVKKSSRTPAIKRRQVTPAKRLRSRERNDRSLDL